MNVPVPELKDFLEEYGALTFPGHRVLRADFFCHLQNTQWQPVFLLEQAGNQLLATNEDILYRCDRITPLFVPPEKTKAAWLVEDLLEQLSGLRSRVPRNDYEKARDALASLAQPLHPFCPAYLVEQAGQLGIVDPLGQSIVPAEYASIETFAFSDPGEAALFLCHRGGHHLNSMDVYDQKGNCIFRQISRLQPREETALTSAASGSATKKTKSLWVIRQAIDHPFPEDPDFQLVQDEPRRFAVKELRRAGDGELHLAAMDEKSVWRYCDPAETPPRDALLPLATVVGHALGTSADEVLTRLSDYRRFRQERLPLALRLAKVRPDTSLDKLGLSIRAHHCLVRSGLRTAADVAALSEETLCRLRRCTTEILQEITALRDCLDELL